MRALGAVYGPYTGRCFGSTRDTDKEHIVATSEAHDSGLPSGRFSLDVGWGCGSAPVVVCMGVCKSNLGAFATGTQATTLARVPSGTDNHHLE